MTRRIVQCLWLGCALSLAAGGCATTNSEVKHGLGVGQWQARLPTTASPIHELAYGRGGSSVGYFDDSLADLGNVDELLRTEPLVQTTQPKAKLAKHVAAPKRLTANDAPAKLAEPAPSEPVAAATPQPQAAEPPVLLAQNDARDRYAGREQQAKEQKNFRGGDAVVVISASALLIVLLIVLLILLLR